MSRILSWLTFYCGMSIVYLDSIHKRHEYVFTFKDPVITVNNDNEIPFFDFGGNVIASKERVRLTASLSHQQGWIWSKNTSSFEGFEVNVVFKITGNGRIGSDGLALWIVQSRSFDGPAFGASAKWQGLAVMFDTYASSGHEQHQSVIGIVNNGSLLYKSDTDGRDISIGSCNRELRNQPYWIHCRVTYLNQLLVVSMSNGLSNPHTSDLDECFRATVDLPRAEYYFGLTSSTGLMADDHDVQRMEVFSLTDVARVNIEEEKLRAEAHKRYEEEYQRKIEVITKTEITEEKSNADVNEIGISQNLMAIWQEIAGQHSSMKDLIMSVGRLSNTINTDERSSVISHMEGLRKEISSIKDSAEHASRKIEDTDISGQNQRQFVRIHNDIDSLKRDILNVDDQMINIYKAMVGIKERGPSQHSCRDCLSLHTIIILSALQTVFVIGFIVYQQTRESATRRIY